MGRRYFGTDGVRGRVGEAPITPDFIMKLGWAIGKVVSPEGGGNVLIGKDTRISGYMMESALEAGLSAAGVDVTLLGPLPTPGVSYLSSTFRARAGLVVSASHNAFHDNGVKIFGPSGKKLSDEQEAEIEHYIDHDLVVSDRVGRAFRQDDAQGRYVEACKATVPPFMTLQGMKLVIDCANGATYQVAPQVFRELGAEVVLVGVNPDGYNINDACGSTSPETMAEVVRSSGADMGIGFDGDGDRVVMVDGNGRVIDGDELLYVIARSRQLRQKQDTVVVGTLMSNLGLELAIKDMGMNFVRANVGDRYVLKELLRHNGTVGGESSGHILCLDKASTGDGIISALQVLRGLRDLDMSLAEVTSGMEKLPQKMINVRVQKKIDVSSDAAIQDAVRAAEAEMGDQGRVLLRPSGTEPVIRVMVESVDESMCQQQAQVLATVVEASCATAAA